MVAAVGIIELLIIVGIEKGDNVSIKVVVTVTIRVIIMMMSLMIISTS